MADTAVETVIVNVGEMIDLAIGSPEVGVVDFNMLHSVLHVLAQQIRVRGKNVELRGSQTYIPTRVQSQTVAITEYLVKTDDTADKDNPVIIKIDEAPSGTPAATDTLLVVERIKKIDKETQGEPDGAGGGRTSTATGTAGIGAKGGQRPATATGGSNTVSASRQASIGTTGRPASASGGRPSLTTGGPEQLSLVTVSKFNLLENTVKDLKNRVYGSIPTNEDILEEVRSQSNLKSITDMWTSLNVSSRLEAAEAGLTKLSSLLQDIIGDAAKIQLPDKITTAADALDGQPGTKEGATQEGLTVAIPMVTNMDEVNDVLQHLRAYVDDLATNFNAALEELGLEHHQTNVTVIRDAATDSLTARELAGGGEMEGEGGLAAEDSTTSSIVCHGAQYEETEETPDSKIQDSGSAGERKGSGKPVKGGMDPTITARLNKLEKKIDKCCNDKKQIDTRVQDKLNSFQDQLEYMSKQLANMSADIAVGKMSDEFVKNVEGLMNLVGTVQDMQEQLKEVHEAAYKISMEKEERQQHLNALLEQIELLKTIKLDREDMVEAMAEKADLRQLARKVSHDQFETACDDLTRGVERALGKLNIQEALWQQALDDIQREIEAKLDKMELSPVKDFFNKKLRQLQNNLKQMMDLRKEVEAAGTKRRLLRDVNCISCDAKAVMASEVPGSLPVSKAMPQNLSMKPYLSYELDTIRKQQANQLPQRNLNDWENIDKQVQQKPTKVRSETDKHLCNRYCGGSHTVTTASQRVVRLGHFIKQWGPAVLPLSSGLATGDDGRMYKVTTDVPPEPVPEVPPPSKPKIEPCTKPPKPVKPECRCLEPAENPKA